MEGTLCANVQERTEVEQGSGGEDGSGESWEILEWLREPGEWQEGVGKMRERKGSWEDAGGGGGRLRLGGWPGGQDTGLGLCFSITTLSSDLGSARLSFLCSLTTFSPHSSHQKRRFRDPSAPNEEGLNYQSSWPGRPLSVSITKAGLPS